MMATLTAVDGHGRSASIVVGDAISFGGEGTIHSTNWVGCYAKIYTSGRNIESKYQKCRLYLNLGLDNRNIAFPTHLLFKDSGFVGFVMPAKNGRTLAEVCNPMIVNEEFPDLARSSLVKICKDIASHISYLHKHEILMCDINLNNFLVSGLGTRQQEVFLIDCDSYQIGDFNGEVGHPAFTPPELQGKQLPDVRRTVEHERFSVTVLLFMVLMVGMKPYAMKGGASTEAEGVRQGLFPYPRSLSGDRSRIPNEWAWGIWTWMPKLIRDTFWNNLHRDGENYAPQKRTPVCLWGAFMGLIEAETEYQLCSQGCLEHLKVFPEPCYPPKDKFSRFESYVFAKDERYQAPPASSPAHPTAGPTKRPKTPDPRTTRNATTPTTPAQVRTGAAAAAAELNPAALHLVGRNDACPCGSGRKFKDCHGRKTNRPYA